MSNAKLLVAIFIAVLSISALASATASAAPAEWMLNGKTLLEEGLTTAALKTLAVVDKSGILSWAGLTIECPGELLGENPEIIMPNIIKVKSLILMGCGVVAPVACSIPSTIGTVPVEGEATLDGPLAVKGIVHPQTGKVFTTILVTGTECATAGGKPISGDAELLAPEGQDERTDQLLVAKQGSTGLLKLGSESASLEGTALILLANGAAWSFL